MLTQELAHGGLIDHKYAGILSGTCGGAAGFAGQQRALTDEAAGAHRSDLFFDSPPVHHEDVQGARMYEEELIAAIILAKQDLASSVAGGANAFCQPVNLLRCCRCEKRQLSQRVTHLIGRQFESRTVRDQAATP